MFLINSRNLTCKNIVLLSRGFSENICILESKTHPHGPFLLLLHSAAVENKCAKYLPHPGINLLSANWTHIILIRVVIQVNYYFKPNLSVLVAPPFLFLCHWGHASSHPFRFCQHGYSLKTYRLLPSVCFFFVCLVLLQGKGHLKALVFT